MLKTPEDTASAGLAPGQASQGGAGAGLADLVGVDAGRGLVGVAVAFQEDAAGLAEVDDGEARDLAGPQGLEVVDGGLDPALRVLPGAEHVQVLEVFDQAPGGLVGGAGEADVVAAVVGEDAGLGVEETAGVAPLRAARR